MIRNIRHSILIALFAVVNISTAQVLPDTSFPRIWWHGWLTPPHPEYLKYFSVTMTWSCDSARIKQYVKPDKPNFLHILTEDINHGHWFRDDSAYNNMDLPSVWYVKNAEGGNYRELSEGDYLVDPTIYCPTYTGVLQTTMGAYYVVNKNYRDALIDIIVQRANLNIFDGVGSDGSWAYPWGTGIDLDRNADDDITEHGSAWVATIWQQGHRYIVKGIRDGLAAKWGKQWDDIYTSYNTRSAETGYGRDTFLLSYSNGAWNEAMFTTNEPRTWAKYFPHAMKWDTASRFSGHIKPYNRISVHFDYDTSYGGVCNGGKKYYRFMRWALGWGLLTGQWVLIAESDQGNTSVGSQTQPYLYDEYFTGLGNATSIAQAIGSTGCYARFFDSGMVIVNPTNVTTTIDVSDISGLTGYDGPYYRFFGNQDSLTNNGTLFDSVTLVSTAPKPRLSGWSTTQYVGDAIILLNSEKIVVADIIIDNSYSSTSPGQDPATFSGTWTTGSMFTYNRSQLATPSSINPTFSMYRGDAYSTLPANYRAAYASAGTGTATATYNVNLAIAGYYNLYMWHGWLGQDSATYLESSNVPVTVYHASGDTTVYVNQRSGYREWKHIGRFKFNNFPPQKVVVSNNTSTGYVIADAFKWVWESYDPPPEQPTVYRKLLIRQP